MLHNITHSSADTPAELAPPVDGVAAAPPDDAAAFVAAAPPGHERLQAAADTTISAPHPSFPAIPPPSARPIAYSAFPRSCSVVSTPGLHT